MVPSKWLFSILLFIVLSHKTQSLFFGGGQSCGQCPTTCPVCSPCSGAGNYAYPSNYGGISSYSYPTQYSQNYQSSSNYAVGQSFGQPASGYVKSPQVASFLPQQQYSQALPPLISAPTYQQQPSVPVYQNLQPSVPSYQQPVQQYQQETQEQFIAPPGYQEQPIVQPTTQSYQPEIVTPQVTPEQVHPSQNSYLDVDVQPTEPNSYNAGYGNQVPQVDATTQSYTPNFSPSVQPASQTYNPSFESTTQTSTQSSYNRDEDVPDYLQPTGLDDPLLGRQNNEQPPIKQKKRSRIFGSKTRVDPSRCNNDDLKKIMEESITVSPSISKRRVQENASKFFNGTFDVICSYNHFSYVASTQLFCEYTSKDIICFAFLHKFN